MKVGHTKKLFVSLSRIERRLNSIQRALETLGYTRELEKVLSDMVVKAQVMNEESRLLRLMHEEEAHGSIL